MLNSTKRKELQSQAHHLKAQLQVGKEGVTSSFRDELVKTAKKKGLVKVRLLQSHTEEHDRHSSAQQLVIGTGLELISMVGNTVVVWWPGSSDKQ